MQHKNRAAPWLSRALAIAAAIGSITAACAQPAAEAAFPTTEPLIVAARQDLPLVQVLGNYQNGVGTSDAASQGSVSAKLIENRPTLRSAELLEFVPGVIVTQHSGDGKANQYFLRGFNLDHGTDFATWVDGMPVNMPTHAHGHGYSDLNWLIPELVDRIAYKKGPYYAEEGDFSSAGAAHIRLFDTLPQRLASATFGPHGYKRALLAGSGDMGSGKLLVALEAAHNHGPWDNPENFHRFNGVLRYSRANDDQRDALTAMAYSAGWNATDQVPQRAVDQGLIGRFGTIDPSDGGQTERFSLAYDMHRKLADGRFAFNAYAVRSRLDLFSNFSFFLDHPSDSPADNPSGIDGDQFQQAERRTLFGAAVSRSWNGTLAGRESITTLGAQWRHDRLAPVGLYSTVTRQRAAVTQESRVRQTSFGVHAENATQWTPWLRGVAGLRADRFDFKVDGTVGVDSGSAGASIVSPKLSLIFGPWRKTEAFVNVGHGFHSNDARGATARIDPATPLVRSRGAELGLRSELITGLQSSLALWRLDLGSELLFIGDAGNTEASRASRRHGVEWNNHWLLGPGLLLDADLALSRARFTQDDPAGNSIPGAIEKVASFGVSVLDHGPWSGQFQLRYFGPRALVEDDSKRSASTTLAYLRVGYRLSPKLKLAFDVFNLFGREGSDIDYFYTSRLKGEALGGVDDIHSHPVEPRSWRVTLVAGF